MDDPNKFLDLFKSADSNNREDKEKKQTPELLVVVSLCTPWITMASFI